MKKVGKYFGILLGLVTCMTGTYWLSYKLTFEALLDITEHRTKKLQANKES